MPPRRLLPLEEQTRSQYSPILRGKSDSVLVANMRAPRPERLKRLCRPRMWRVAIAYHPRNPVGTPTPFGRWLSLTGLPVCGNVLQTLPAAPNPSAFVVSHRFMLGCPHRVSSLPVGPQATRGEVLGVIKRAVRF